MARARRVAASAIGVAGTVSSPIDSSESIRLVPRPAEIYIISPEARPRQAVGQSPRTERTEPRRRIYRSAPCPISEARWCARPYTGRLVNLVGPRPAHVGTFGPPGETPGGA